MCPQGLGHEMPGNPLGYVALDVSNQQFRRSVIADSSQTPRSVWSTMSIQHAQVSQASQWSAMSANPPRSVTTPLLRSSSISRRCPDQTDQLTSMHTLGEGVNPEPLCVIFLLYNSSKFLFSSYRSQFFI